MSAAFPHGEAVMAKRSKAVLADGERAISDKSRANPIKSTIRKVNGLHRSAILYRCAASSYWQFRVYLEGKLRKRSTQELEFDKAQRKAKLIFSELLASIHSGETKAEPTTRKSLDMIARSLWAKNETRIINKELNKEKVAKDKYIYERHIKPFFSRYDVKDIDADLLEQFKTNLAKKGLSAATQLSYIQLIMALLIEAQKKRLIATVPPKPRVKTDDGVRGYFDDRQMAKLHQVMRKHVGERLEIKDAKGKTYKRVEITPELIILVDFMVDTYIRPTDIKVLKHKHIHVVTKAGMKFITLRHGETKGHKKQMTSTESGYRVYLMIRDLHGRESLAKPEDYLFQPKLANRDTALKNLATQFTVILAKAGMRKDEDGKPRTLYSLRHTAIVSSIRKGLDLELIASNSRTSTDMIRRFYGSHVDNVFDMGDEFLAAETGERNKRYDRANKLAKEINVDFDAYDEDPEADKQFAESKVKSMLRMQKMRRGDKSENDDG